jgi:hypothetical protein
MGGGPPRLVLVPYRTEEVTHPTSGQPILVTFSAPTRSEEPVPGWPVPFHWDYIIRLEYQGRKTTIPHSTGPASNPDTLHAVDVLEMLRADCETAANTYFDYAEEFGYDPKDHDTLNRWRKGRALAQRVRRMFGDDYDGYMMIDWSLERHVNGHGREIWRKENKPWLKNN